MFSSLSSIARQAEACQPESSWLEISSPSSASDKKPKKPIQHRPSRPSTKLVTYHELPDWYQDNPHIHSGYRPVSNSSSACINSLKYVHNETINIYSHLIPGLTAVLAALFLNAYFDSRFPDADVADKLVFGVFLAAAATCLGISAAFHTFISHSEEICHRWLLCDFVGIIALNMGDALSGIYMVFYCEPVERDLYWTTTLSLGVTTAVMMVSPWFKGKKWRTFRTCCFVGCGLSGIVPLVHGVRMFGWEQMNKQSGMPYYMIEGAFLLGGAFIYGMRIPESIAPGRFDILGSSHQIFHLFVVAATVTHFVGLGKALDYNIAYRQCSV